MRLLEVKTSQRLSDFWSRLEVGVVELESVLASSPQISPRELAKSAGDSSVVRELDRFRCRLAGHGSLQQIIDLLGENCENWEVIAQMLVKCREITVSSEKTYQFGSF